MRLKQLPRRFVFLQKGASTISLHIEVEIEIVPLEQVLAKAMADVQGQLGSYDLYYLDQSWVSTFKQHCVDPVQLAKDKLELLSTISRFSAAWQSHRNASAELFHFSLVVSPASVKVCQRAARVVRARLAGLTAKGIAAAFLAARLADKQISLQRSAQ